MSTATALTMSEEIRAIDAKDAAIERDKIHCDRCGEPGFDFLAGAWLCRFHLEAELRAFFREAYGNVAR